jgi:UDP-N-acetylglucosamine diphosphorylase / glucose-1-phosphate thymidylyltransferase / UDP-N-acetylgalactosamine diphosphorylase / glucosamine-1-phosphate N-acetyltransferase / galactosamine-1-phosphate N-acetyltransferase
MLKIILHAPNLIMPFCEPARDLRIQNAPLWLRQRDLLAPYVTHEQELKKGDRLKPVREPTIVYRDNLFFDEFYIKAFMEKAIKGKKPVRAAFRAEDPAFREHALPLSTSYTPAGSLYLADLWYYPNGPVADVEPLVIDMQATEVGYYHVPTYMADKSGDLVFQVPGRAMIAIDCWVHIFIADIVFGQFARAQRNLHRTNTDAVFKLELLFKSIYEGRQFLRNSGLVKIGKDCNILPGVIINGPTIIGNNVKIEEGSVIDNCVIGDNVNISQGCQLMLSVVGDGTFLPFRASLFMTTIMEDSMVAQNTCLQMCVVGKRTFIGAGSTWTDYNLIPAPIRARDGAGKLGISNRPVLGGCVGHNCRIGAGMIVYPARTIESDVVLAASKDRRIIDRDILFEDSDHHHLKSSDLHQVLYHKQSKGDTESW